jgi:hypothetical protein
MNEKALLKWGGICALIFMVLFIVWGVIYWTSQGISSQIPKVNEWAGILSGSVSRISVVLFSIFMCFYVIAAYATYDYLLKTSYTFSRIGFAFVLLWIIIVFIKTGIIAAGNLIVLSAVPDFATQLSILMVLYSSFHILAIWFWALFPFFWALAFIKLRGNDKIVGVLFLVLSILAILYYIFFRIGNIWIAEIIHLVGHVVFAISNFFLALVLLEEYKKS